MRNFILFLVVVAIAAGAYGYFVDPTFFGMVEADTATQVGDAANDAADAVSDAAESAADAAADAADSAADAVDEATSGSE